MRLHNHKIVMKRIILFTTIVFLFAVTHTGIKAQNNRGNSSKYTDKAITPKTHVIEPAILEVKYNVIYGKYRDVYALRCGKNVSQFINLYNLRCDSLYTSPDPAIRDIPFQEYMESMTNKMNGTTSQRPNSPGKLDYLYWNLKPGKLSIYTIVSRTHYVAEDTPTINWEICEDTVQTILGYTCHRATARFRGREWEVWYADDIPTSLGPWKLNGLPGLILQAFSDDFISYVACSIETKGLAPVTFYNYHKFKFEPITWENYFKARNDPKNYPPQIKMTTERDLERELE